MKPDDEKNFERVSIAQAAGWVLFIVAIEFHIVSRPVVFLLAPLATWSFLTLAYPAATRRARWRGTLAIAVVSSVVLYLVFAHLAK